MIRVPVPITEPSPIVTFLPIVIFQSSLHIRMIQLNCAFPLSVQFRNRHHNSWMDGSSSLADGHLISKIKSFRTQSMYFKVIFKFHIFTAANVFTIRNLYPLSNKQYSMCFFQKGPMHPSPAEF